MQANVKTKNGKELWIKALVDPRCTHMRIDEQLVKKEKIKTKLSKISFKVFNADSTKNGEVTRIVPLEVNQWTQRTNWCSSNRFKWYRHVFGTHLIGKTQSRSELERRHNTVYKIPKDM